MLKKTERMKKEMFDFVFNNGKIFNSKNITLRFNKNKNINISFVVPKKNIKLATERNLFKRRGYYVIRKHKEKIKTPFSGIFIIKKTPKDYNFKDFEEEILFLLKKTNVI